MESIGILLGLGYIICAAILLPLTVAFLWTGIGAFRAVRRVITSIKSCSQCGNPIANPDAKHCGKCGQRLSYGLLLDFFRPGP